MPSSAKINPSFYSWRCSSIHSLCAFQIPMATWRRHTLECKPVLFYMLRFTWEGTYIWSQLWLQLWIAQGHIWKTCWIAGRLSGPIRGQITFSACRCWRLGTDRAQIQTLMLQVTRSILPHTFSPNKQEDGGMTTGGKLVLKSSSSLKLTFWRVELGSVGIRSRQGMRQTLQWHHFPRCAHKELLTRILWCLCKHRKIDTADAKCVPFVTLFCLRLSLNACGKWTGGTRAL